MVVEDGRVERVLDDSQRQQERHPADAVRLFEAEKLDHVGEGDHLGRGHCSLLEARSERSPDADDFFVQRLELPASVRVVLVDCSGRGSGCEREE